MGGLWHREEGCRKSGVWYEKNKKRVLGDAEDVHFADIRCFFYWTEQLGALPSWRGGQCTIMY